jgi:predicted enzyme related to lactoylglutathione lyase
VSVPKRNEYPAGVPCWIDTAQPDPGAAVDLYGGLFGWKFENMMPPDSPQPYLMGRLAERTIELGGSVLVEPFDAEAVRIAVLADPQGAVSR